MNGEFEEIEEKIEEASKAGDFQKVIELFGRDETTRMQKDKALYVASIKGHLEIVKFLIENGVNVNADCGKPLSSASRGNHIDVVKYLVENGADVNLPVYSINSLDIAASKGNINVVKYLIEKGSDIHHLDDMPLYCAVESNHIKTVKYLIENGANINVLDNIIIRTAIKNDYVKVVKYLIEKGADISSLPIRYRLEYGVMSDGWTTKPEDIPAFKKLSECPISQVKLTEDIPQLGCSKCLNVFEKTVLEDWFKIGRNTCPMCRTGRKFYLV